MTIFILYLILINIFGYFICWYDKMQAIHRKYRVSEKFLFAVAMAGGVFGIHLAIYFPAQNEAPHLYDGHAPVRGGLAMCDRGDFFVHARLEKICIIGNFGIYLYSDFTRIAARQSIFLG